MPTLRDCVYGQALADAVGVPYEFRPRGTFCCTDMIGHGSRNKLAGTWSDDTSMTLAICDSYRELGRIDVDDIRGRFVRWCREGAYTVGGLFDIGNATHEALERGHGLSGERNNGSGSLMRTVPLAFIDATDDEVRAVSAITHAHPTSAGRASPWCISCRTSSPARVRWTWRVTSPHDLQKRSAPAASCATHSTSRSCLANTSSYAERALAAVNLGDDTDTTAAVAGALAGIVYGIEGILFERLDKLQGTDLIEACPF